MENANDWLTSLMAVEPMTEEEVNEMIVSEQKAAHQPDPKCPRCNGTGRLPQYGHYNGGICFKCNRNV